MVKRRPWQVEFQRNFKPNETIITPHFQLPEKESFQNAIGRFLVLQFQPLSATVWPRIFLEVSAPRNPNDSFPIRRRNCEARESWTVYGFHGVSANRRRVARCIPIPVCFSSLSKNDKTNAAPFRGFRSRDLETYVKSNRSPFSSHTGWSSSEPSPLWNERLHDFRIDA